MQVNKAGLWGEIYAARYLRDRNYEILAGNYRCRMGEIDIVARKDGVVCFVEVKARGTAMLFRPMEAVDAGKRRRLVNAAAHYIRTVGETFVSRFDVIEVTLDERNQPLHINHIQDAFTPLDESTFL